MVSTMQLSPELVGNEYEIREDRIGSVHIICSNLTEPKIAEVSESIRKVFKHVKCEILDENIYDVKKLEDVTDALIHSKYIQLFIII